MKRSTHLLKKRLVTALAAALVVAGSPAWAATAAKKMPDQQYKVPSVTDGGGPTAQQLYAQASGELFQTKHAAIAAAVQAWSHGEGIKPIVGQGGIVLWPYNQGVPTDVCSPVQVCDIQLVKGDVPVSVVVGNTAQWLVQPGWSGQAAKHNLRANIFVKPVADHLQTNMIITTNTGRVYSIVLKSKASGYDPVLQFFDPEHFVQQDFPKPPASLTAMPSAQKPQRTVASLPDFSVEAMDFCSVHGDAPFRPLRAFTVEGKTYIDEPQSVQYHDMPVFLGLSSNGNKEIMNYTPSGSWLIVDGLFRKGELVSGKGSNQQKVTIKCGGDD